MCVCVCSITMPAGEGKSDMERLGVFQEMGYVSIGDKYVPARYSKLIDLLSNFKLFQNV